MSRYLLHHRHDSRECRAAFAAWSGFASPLRRHAAVGSCHFDDHQIWWRSIAPLPGFAESYTSLTAFYAADDRRWPSPELDLGLRWRGSGRSTYRAAFIEATGELYVFEHLRPDGGGGMVFVHERRHADRSLAEAFDGWEDVCGLADSLDWFLARVNAARGTFPDASSGPRPGRVGRLDRLTYVL